MTPGSQVALEQKCKTCPCTLQIPKTSRFSVLFHDFHLTCTLFAPYFDLISRLFRKKMPRITWFHGQAPTWAIGRANSVLTGELPGPGPGAEGGFKYYGYFYYFYLYKNMGVSEFRYNIYIIYLYNIYIIVMYVCIPNIMLGCGFQSPATLLPHL